VDSWNRTALIAGLLYVVIGIIFLLDSLDIVEVRAAVVLPLLIIGLGVAVLWGGLFRESRP
jgi:hypothetical protein